MPANKNALLRYKTIDNCLRNRSREWTLDDLIEACSYALYEYTGKDEYISRRTIQLDIQKMRSSELGYEAPIEVYDRRYYRYSDPDFSITNTPLSESDLRQMGEAVGILKQLSGFAGFAGMEDIVGRLEDHLCAVRHERRPAIYFDSNKRLKGLQFITPLYDAIVARTPVLISYQSFKATAGHDIHFSPYILKEYNNRWFVFGRGDRDRSVSNLALDRIISVSPDSGARFIDGGKFDPDTWFDDIVGVTKGKGMSMKRERVRFWVAPYWVPYIETKPIHRSQFVVERNEDGSAIFQLDVIPNFELEKALLEYSDGIRVISPAGLREQVRSRLANGARQYELHPGR